jgi:hypothetical protein
LRTSVAASTPPGHALIPLPHAIGQRIAPTRGTRAAFRQAHGGADPLQWDGDDLARARQLHAKNFGDKAQYLAAGSLADYLGLGRIEEVHLPLPLRILMIGFQVI